MNTGEYTRCMDKKEWNARKEMWIHAWTHDKWEFSDPLVIRFIADILYRTNSDEGIEAIYQLFAAGYCYYFANMLKLAFNRGTVCWHKGFGHIVWVDTDGIAYEIGGIFFDYGEGDLVPVEELGDGLKDFMRVPGTIVHNNGVRGVLENNLIS